jgi:hypothetical protein
VAFVSAVAVWVTSPRFEIDTPSLVDDWAAIERSPDQLPVIARLGNPEDQRFRPSWILWNYVQWHTLDAPQGFVGPNFWNILRIVVLVAGLSLATALALPRPRDLQDAVLYAGLAGGPALLTVVTVPKFARDLARFGIQEPLLVGGMALGGALLVLAAQRLLDVDRPVPRWTTALLAAAGGGLWAVGVYQKEASVCVLPLLAAVLFAGRARLRAWPRASAGRRRLLAVLGAVVVLPLVHVAIEIVRIVSRGDLVYDAEVDAGRGAARGLGTLWDWTHEVFPERAMQLAYVAVAVAFLTMVARRRIDVIVLAVLTTAGLTLLFAGQAGVAVSRYYIPAYALILVAAALSLGRLPRLVQVASLLVVAVAVAGGARGAQDVVAEWVDEEQVGSELVKTVADLEHSGCVVAVAGLDLETSEALPVLVALEPNVTGPRCDPGDTYLVVRDVGEGVPLIRACAPGARSTVWESWMAVVYRCSRLRAEPVRDPTLGLVQPDRLVALRRLRQET